MNETKEFSVHMALLAIFFSSFCIHDIKAITVNNEEHFPYSTRTIAKTTSGDIYDCIDRQSQTGFKVPTLHKPNVSFKNESKGFDLDEIWSGKPCPPGTIPVPQKTGKLQKYTFPPKSFLRDGESYSGGTEFVGIIVNEGELMGAYAEITIWNPKPIHPGQFSAASILVENGEDAIEAGWIVHPDLYQDTQTRLYTAWRTATGGYYNVDYPGFVIVNEEIPLNYVFPRTSNAWGEIDQVAITIQRGDEAGNWYLTVNGNVLGFWKGELFSKLANSAATIRFGGQVYSRPPTKDSPPMGSGRFVNNNHIRTCYMQNVQILMDEFVPPPSYTKIDLTRCYACGGDNYVDQPKRGVKGFHFYIGGKGGHDGTSCVYV
ncbi:OLC1v1013387C1 [Oldenlandia corymbosa var. corymbosa]|uniref:OLC1v1013387C1 n=1 Tax=Oldenlandia corymbosa var. corymbosa TaxID=529605 RepID=A0AAV1DY57_OLDCO|nr:OLC1v1013387C1 [Oldenlandia corymbosa var. corymbosa]